MTATAIVKDITQYVAAFVLTACITFAIVAFATPPAESAASDTPFHPSPAALVSQDRA